MKVWELCSFHVNYVVSKISKLSYIDDRPSNMINMIRKCVISSNKIAVNRINDNIIINSVTLFENRNFVRLKQYQNHL